MEYNNNQNTAKPATSMQQAEESSFDWKALYTIFVLNWQWFALSVFIMLCAAFIYLRYANPVYQVSAKMLVKDEDNRYRRGGNSMLSNMQDLGFISNSNGIDNEIEIVQSHVLAEEAVRNLKLYVQYKREGRIKNRLIYKTQAINVDLDPNSLEKMKDNPFPIKMRISKEGNSYKVVGKAFHIVRTEDSDQLEEVPFAKTLTGLPASFNTVAGTLTFTRNTAPEALPMTEDRDIFATIMPPAYVANGYLGSMEVEATSKMTSIMLITLKDKNSDRGIDFLEQLISCYNQQANADKNEIARKTEEFINGRLEKINNELGLTESQLETYKKSNNLTNLELDAKETLTQASEFSTKLSDAKAQIQLLDYLREYVDNPKNKNQIIPSNVGLKDQSSTTLIASYNESVLDRNRLLRSASELSPQVATLTATLEELRGSIRTALQQARRSADIQLQNIESQYRLYEGRKSSAPEQERILTQIGRQQEVKSGLYLLLLQKREENSISLAATADKGKLIDEPAYEGKVSPKTMIVLLIALVLGIGLPLGVLYLMQLLRYKIEGHEDVAKLTSLPIIADVAVASESAKSAAGIVVHENKNDQIDEIFRSMRTNIQFMLKEGQNVILFTSSTSGEGKTFNAANLAVSFALLGKRVILVGLDIRKPALGRLFGKSDLKIGVTPLLTKEELTADIIDKQIQPSGANPNLDLMLAGPTPPNPTELLARENLKVMIEHLRKKYDYVLLDTAPVGLVTDTLQIAKYTDVSVFVCRADYTPKASLEMVNQLTAEKKLNNTCIVLNGVDMSKKKYGYYYGYGRYGKYGRYSSYGRYGGYGNYGSYGSYGNYSASHYGNKDDDSIKK